MNKIPIPLNAVCIDTSALAKTAFSLSKKFTLIEFLDFCTVIEQLVLRDAILLTGSAYSAQIPMLNRIQPWLKSKAIITAQEKPNPIHVKDTSNSDVFDRHADIVDHDKTSVTDAKYETGRLLAAQVFFKRPALPLVRNYMTFDQVAQPRINQLAFDFISVYGEQTDLIHNMKVLANRRVPNYLQINFPPIAIEILKEAKSFEEMVKLSLQYRTHYSELRTKVNDLEILLRDPTISAAVKSNELNDWALAWNNNLKLDGTNNIILLMKMTVFSNQ